MMCDRDIYILSSRDLSPETIAVAYAKISRSQFSFSEIGAEISDDNIGQFHEICVEGCGHPRLRKCGRELNSSGPLDILKCGRKD